MTNIMIQEILDIVSLQLGVRNIREDSRLLEDLSAESADLMNIVLVLEERYQIAIKEVEMAQIRTPADMFALVNRKLSDR